MSTIRTIARAAVAAFGALAMTATMGLAAATTPTAVAAETQTGQNTQPQITAPGSKENGSRFTMAILPDTQFYSRYSNSVFVPRYGKDPFDVQTQWIADHKKDFGIDFTAQLGDIVDQVDHEDQWQAADKAVKTLDDTNTPYSILPGNHDVTDDVNDNELDLSKQPFLKYFGPNRAQHVSTYGGSDPTGMSQYHIFQAEGQQFIVFAFAWRISDQTIAWAQKVLDDHPTLPAIVTTHDLLTLAADQVTAQDPVLNQKHLWDTFIAKNDQIFLTFNGHIHGATKKVRKNDHGKDVIQVLIDYQMAYEGGNGYMGLSEFDLTHNQFNFTTFSPWVASKPKDKLTSYDQPVLTAPTQQFSITMNFKERFASFNPNFSAGTGSTGSLLAKAQESILKDFPGIPADTAVKPGSTDDYTRVPGTLAFWRPNDLSTGTAVTGDVKLKDASGNGNDMHRLSNEEANSPTSEPSDVTVTDDHDMYSAAGKSLRFANSSNTANRRSALATLKSAPVNNADLSKGYTIEAFVKLDKSWTAADNQWTKILTRTGNRSRITGAPYDRWDGTAAAGWLGISNLREFQWSDLPSDASKGTNDTWSGDVPVDTWFHIAIVDDPATATNTMYIDGVPTLRTGTNRGGMSFEKDMQWIIGAGMTNDKVDNGWNGDIGEVRIIDHPTEKKDWLISRPDIANFTIADKPETNLPEGGKVESLSGTGTPGADITVSGSASGTAKVAENGTWKVTFDKPASGADNTLDVVQHMGTREGGKQQVKFSIAQPDKPGQGGDNGGNGGDEPGQGGQKPEGNGGGQNSQKPQTKPQAGKQAGKLSKTGTDTGIILLVAVSLMVIGAAALVGARRRSER